MKRIFTIITAILVFIFASGCASPGRFSLVDLDLRTPDQIEAYREEALAPFNEGISVEKEEEGEEVTKAVSAWSFLAPILKVFKGRIKILSFEWKGQKGQKGQDQL